MERRTRMTKTKGNGGGGTSIHISLQVEGGVGKELDLCAPVAIFPGIGMCPLLSSEYPVIRPGSMPSAEVTSYKPTSRDLYERWPTGLLPNRRLYARDHSGRERHFCRATGSRPACGRVRRVPRHPRSRRAEHARSQCAVCRSLRASSPVGTPR